MEQAFTLFNSGKYKEALNILNSTNQNFESYQPNVAICQYLVNRCTQSALNCIRRLNDLLAKALRYDGDIIQLRSEQIIKYNIGILLILVGKRSNALLIMGQIFKQKDCFIQYLQCRILFLLMELQINLKNSMEALKIYQNFINRPLQSKNQANLWVSLGIHEHNKSTQISFQQFEFFSDVFVTQALIQLGFPQASLPPNHADKKQAFIERLKKRRNNINKYYEINVLMIDRFLQAQRQYNNGSYVNCLHYLNFTNIHELYQQVTISKVVINILNSLAVSNTGVVHFALGKSTLALYYFKKAKQALQKSPSVQEKQLQLFSANYSNMGEKISQNIALTLLNSRPYEAYVLYDSLKKANNITKNYKFWYRMGQSCLQLFHQQRKQRIPQSDALLQEALEYFSNCLICLKQVQLPTLALSKFYKHLKQDDIEAVILKIRGQISRFQTSAMLMICYTAASLGKYYRVVSTSQQVLQNPKIDSQAKLYATIYLIQAYVYLDRIKQANKLLIDCEKQIRNCNVQTITISQYENISFMMEQNAQILLYYHICVMKIMENNLVEAWNYMEMLRQRTQRKMPISVAVLSHYLNLRLGYPYKGQTSKQINRCIKGS